MPALYGYASNIGEPRYDDILNSNLSREEKVRQIKLRGQAYRDEVDKQRLKDFGRIGLGGVVSAIGALPVAITKNPVIGSAIGGGVYELGQGIMEGDKAPELLKRSGLGGAIGGVAGGAVSKAPQAAKWAANTKAGQAVLNSAPVKAVEENAINLANNLMSNQNVLRPYRTLRNALSQDVKMGVNPFKNTGETQYLFAGERAKNINNLGEYDLAKILDLKEGLKNSDIWKETGWFKGVDGKWRYEIPDGKLKNDIDWLEHWDSNNKPMKTARLPEIYDNPTFYEAYPYAKDLRVNLLDMGGDAAGNYNSWGKEINLDNVYNYRKSNPETYAKLEELRQDPLYIKAHNYDKDIADIRKDYLEYKNSDLRKQEDALLENLSMDGWNEDALRTLQHELQHYIQGVEDFAKGTNSKAAGSYENYLKSAGETESRLVEKRTGLADELLKKYEPFKKGKYGYDVAPTKQTLNSEYGAYGKGKVYSLKNQPLKYRDEWVKIDGKDYHILNIPKKDYGKIMHIVDTYIKPEDMIGEVITRNDDMYKYTFQKISPTDYKFIRRRKIK